MVETAVAISTDLMKKYDVYDKIGASHMKMTGITCIVLYLIGLPYTCRMGGLLMDVIDHFIGSYFLLISCALESIMFRLDFGWERFVLSNKKATMVNPETPEGRIVWPEEFWRFTFYYTVPFFCIALFLSGLVSDMVAQYGGGAIPTSLLAVGWSFFCVILAVMVSKFPDESPSSLPALDPNSPTGFASRSGQGVNEPVAIPTTLHTL